MLEGTVVQWFKVEGDTVTEGDPLAEIEASKTTEELAAPADGVLGRILVGPGETVPVHELLAVLDAPGEPAGAVAPSPGRPQVAVPVTPRARRLASELGVDLAGVAGSGPGGRIDEEDVRAVAAAPVGEAVPAIPLSRMRSTIASRMVSSLQSTAQLTLTTTVDVTDLVAYRETVEGPGRPSYTDLVVKAAAVALRRHPGLNASLEGERILLWPHVNVGIATALEEGLVVPVIRDADRKSLAEITAESTDLVARARTGAISGQDISGSTFTVTSLGAHGIDAFTPIVNPPEVAILGIGRITDQPAPADGAITWRKVMTLSLTVDHRVIDGAPGAEFLATVCALLSSTSDLIV
jgi:pyruvate dehydrogenase E2 component (dihydrolipoamide acetyltransferase)